MTNPIHLIIGATGVQGGATARSLLGAGKSVRAMVRKHDAPAAIALAAEGAELVSGDLDDPNTLDAAMAGVHALFSVLRPDPAGSDLERRQGMAVVEAAKRAGITHVIHSTVCQAGTHESFPRWHEGYWSTAYWTDKWAVEQFIHDAGFEFWTILRPSFIMTNLTRSRAPVLFPQLSRGQLVSPVWPDAKVQLIAPEDIGAFTVAAFADPQRYNRQTIELAGDELTMGEIAAVLASATGNSVEAISLSPDEAIASGIPATWVRSQEWTNHVGYLVDRTKLAAYGLPMTRLAVWAKVHVNDFQTG